MIKSNNQNRDGRSRAVLVKVCRDEPIAASVAGHEMVTRLDTGTDTEHLSLLSCSTTEPKQD